MPRDPEPSALAVGKRTNSPPHFVQTLFQNEGGEAQSQNGAGCQVENQEFASNSNSTTPYSQVSSFSGKILFYSIIFYCSILFSFSLSFFLPSFLSFFLSLSFARADSMKVEAWKTVVCSSSLIISYHLLYLESSFDAGSMLTQPSSAHAKLQAENGISRAQKGTSPAQSSESF